MKTTILSIALMLGFHMAFSQNFMPEVVPYTLTGFNKLRNDNPFILSQSAGPNNTWSNLASYTWIPSAIPGYNKERTTSQFSGNTWIMNQLEQNEVNLDDQNRITNIIENRTQNYNGTQYRSKFKYQFTYNTQNKPSHILVQVAEAPSYINFVNFYNYSYSYNTQGQLISDSLYNYTDQQSYKRDYTYDANGKPASQTYFEYSSDDTTGKTWYTFVNDRLHTTYAISLDLTSGNWETTSTDTFDYDLNGNIIKRISYGAAFINGDYIPFMPVTNDTYSYNSLNKMDQMESKVWNSDLSAWVNAARYTFNYTNNNPSVGYLYNWNTTAQTYDTDPTVRFLFALPTALHENNGLTASGMAIYPNPATNKVFISGLMSGAFQQSAISLYNLSGQLCSVPVIYQNGIAEVDISHLSSGIYSIQIQSGETVIRKKLLVR